MIHIPDSNLKRALDAIKPENPDDPISVAEASKAHDVRLAGAWKTLAGEAKDALDLLLVNLEGQCLNDISSPQISAETRQFIAGRLRAVYEIQAGIENFLKFNPDETDYAAEQSFGDPDAVEGLGDDIVY
jgi:hypothetical protein